LSKVKAVTPAELKRVEAYLRRTFGSNKIEVRGRQKAADAAEVYINGDFAGVVAKDTEDGELCFQFTMTILEIDLE
jgi:hypothetical protein